MTRSSTRLFFAFAGAAALIAAGTGCQSGGFSLFGYQQADHCCSSSCTAQCGGSACCPSGNSNAAAGGNTMVASNGAVSDPNVVATGFHRADCGPNGCDPSACGPNGCDPNGGACGPNGGCDPNGRYWPYGPRPLPRGVGGCWDGPQGPPTGGVAYPYYTNRGPRDFLDPNPPSIGP